MIETFYFYGRSVQRFNGFATDGVTPVVLTAREPFYRFGGDFSFNYHAFNLYGMYMYMYGHDKNLLPFTLASAAEGPNGFVSGVPATFSGGFVQADYMLLPWVMGIMRYDVVKSSADRINTFGGSLSPFISNAQPLYSGGAVPDSRQHQGRTGVSDPATTDGLRQRRKSDCWTCKSPKAEPTASIRAATPLHNLSYTILPDWSAARSVGVS